MRTIIFALALWGGSLYAVSPSETAVFTAFRQSDASLSHFFQLQRTSVTEGLDLIIVMGSPKAFPAEIRWLFWGEDRKIGLFLQEKNRPDRVYLLGTKSGFPDCEARVERATATDSVISCHGEKFSRYPNQKWVYDVKAKHLIRQFSYEPFAMYRIFREGSESHVFVGRDERIGSDERKLIAIEYHSDVEPVFRVLSDAGGKPWISRVDISADKKQVPASVQAALPRTTYDQFAAARPQRVKDGYVRQGTELAEFIGPWLREDSRIWFGKTFYDGEGSTGVGGFGYFDQNEKKLHLFTPPGIADWSVSAIDVTPDAVWMGLVGNGEGGYSIGGLLRYDRQTGVVRRFPLPDVALALDHRDGEILAATDFGIAIVKDDHITRFFVDQTTDGRWRVVPAAK